MLQGRMAACSNVMRMLQGPHVTQNAAASRAAIIGRMHQRSQNRRCQIRHVWRTGRGIYLSQQTIPHGTYAWQLFRRFDESGQGMGVICQIGDRKGKHVHGQICMRYHGFALIEIAMQSRRAHMRIPETMSQSQALNKLLNFAIAWIFTASQDNFGNGLSRVVSGFARIT